MASISSLGIGSGLDSESIITKLVSVESAPITALQTKASGISTKISAFSQLKSQISNLQDQVTALTSKDTWLSKSLTSSSSSVVTGTVTSKATSGTYDVKVSKLASGQTVSSSPVASGTSLGSGSLTITLGTWKDGVLTPNSGSDSGSSLTVEITDSDDSLSKIAAKINAAKGGVSATVMKDLNGERLVLQSSSTGENTAFSISATGDGLKQFEYAGTDSSTGMSKTQSAQDTIATINGISMTSHTATFDEVAQGLSLTVSQQMANDASPVRITVSNDSSAGKKALQNLVSSYNALSSALSTMTAYNADTKTAGTLQGDSTANNLQSALRRILVGNGGSNGAFSSLSQMGLSFQTDGTLAIDDTKLGTALEDQSSMSDFFAVDVDDANQDGLAVKLKTFTSGLLASDGSFATKDASLQAALKRNTADQTAAQARVSAYETRLRAQYSRLDTTMASLTALNTYVEQQITTWNKSTS